MGEGVAAPAMDSRLAKARVRATNPTGWRLLYRRGYSIRAPPDYARGWLVRHLPFQGELRSSDAERSVTILARAPYPAVRVEFLRHHLQRLTEWDLSDPSAVVAHDSIWKGPRLELLASEAHHFYGDGNGSIVEITVRRKPASLVSRIGFALDPMGPGNPAHEESAMLEQIDKEYRASPRVPA